MTTTPTAGATLDVVNRPDDLSIRRSIVNQPEPASTVGPRHVVLVSAGLSQPSSTRLLGDRLAEATVAALAEQGVDATVETVELRDHAHAIMDAMLTGFASGDLAQVIEDVTGADALVLVTPLFTTTYSGLFKSFVDILDKDSLVGMPVLLGATGGTPRHSLALEYGLRPLFTYLRADVVTTSVFAATDDWAEAGGSAGTLPERVRRAGGELARTVASRAPRAQASGSAEPFSGTPSFEDLLGGLAG
ncbi:FMN reductase (NADPH) [Luteimicrobium xylanilyticum]|uniref:FMN reductase (NADPH) n=1 Tax=Luteimicrobium xylanilyticum TaxID=1133546 RepID=A0A5P9Q9Y3_9MICO|nr:FMN reductase (NADPH) [Luteimicrobium xylanilyticum]